MQRECDGRATGSVNVDQQVSRLGQEFVDAVFAGRFGGSTAMEMGAAIKGVNDAMCQMNPAAKTEFEQKIGQFPGLNSEHSGNYLPELSLVYMQEMSRSIDRNRDGISKEELTEYGNRRGLNAVEKLLVQQAIRSFDTVRNADTADTTQYMVISANSDNITRSDLDKELLRHRRNRANEG